MRRFIIFAIILSVFVSCVKRDNPDERTNKTYKEIVWAKNSDGEMYILSKSAHWMNGKPFFNVKRTYYKIKEKEIDDASIILKRYLLSKNYKDTDLNNYFKQFVGFEENGKKKILVNFFTHFVTTRHTNSLCVIAPNLTESIYNPLKGNTKDFVLLTIDIKTSRIEPY